MLVLTAHQRSDRIPLEVECLAPDALRELSLAEIEGQLIYHGAERVRLADFFSVRGDPSDGEIRLVGDCSAVKWIGHGMKSGRIVIEGNAGMHTGSEMAGGQIVVQGNAGDWVGAEMTGGHIHVRGNAGHLIGAVYRGGRVGMKGGVILVDGRAGGEIGASMRRGLIAIGGDCGDFPGVAMRAGSILVFGKPGIRPGAGMKRGTIVFFGLGDDPAPVLPTFRYDCDYRPQFLGLYLAQLRRWEFPIAEEAFRRGAFQRYNGDMLELGKGEILAWRDHRSGAAPAGRRP